MVFIRVDEPRDVPGRGKGEERDDPVIIDAGTGAPAQAVIPLQGFDLQGLTVHRKDETLLRRFQAAEGLLPQRIPQQIEHMVGIQLGAQIGIRLMETAGDAVFLVFPRLLHQVVIPAGGAQGIHLPLAPLYDGFGLFFAEGLIGEELDVQHVLRLFQGDGAADPIRPPLVGMIHRYGDEDSQDQNQHQNDEDQPIDAQAAMQFIQQKPFHRIRPSRNQR